MSALYDAEIQQYLRVISGKDHRIDQLLITIRKACKMMEHPRLMQLIIRELNFDRFEYTWEERLAVAKQEINFTPAEEAEIRQMGIVLCPETLKEFYTYVRAAEKSAG